MNGDVFAAIGGQGSKAPCHETQAGDGGIAGQGGIIKVSKLAKIEAYNGSRYTSDNALGNAETQLNIVAQDGILRKVYKYSVYFESREFRGIDFFRKLFKETVVENLNDYKENNVKPWDNYLIRDEKACSKSGYINPVTNSTQGVGSRCWLYRTFKRNL